MVAGPGSTTRRLRGAGALLVLLVALVGVPWALLQLAGPPWPTGDPVTLWRSLLRPDDGRLLVALIALVAWVAWAVFAVAVLAELIALVRAGPRVRLAGPSVRLPGLGGPQQLAGALLLAVVAAVVAPVVTRTPAVSAPTPPTPTAAPPVPDATRAPLGAAAPSTPAVPKGHLHVVRPGDDLWSLAERFYGQGREWRRIAAANPDVLTGGPDRLRVGTRLAIPGVPTAPEGGRRVVVQDGDTLSALAEREYGDADRWRDLYRANRHLIADPDAIDVGLVLSVPHRPAARSEPPSPPSAEARQPAPASTPAAPSTPPVPPPVPPSAPPSASAPEAPSPITPEPPAELEAADEEVAADEAALPIVAGVGGLLAAGLLGGLLLRRRAQLARRPVGRRILHAGPVAQRVEAALGRRQRPVGRATLDLVLRALAWHCHRDQRPLPEVLAVRLSDAEVELVLRTPQVDPPVGFRADGRRWVVTGADAGYLAELDGVEVAPRAYPTLVGVGTDDDGRLVLVELEQAGVFGYAGFDSEAGLGLVSALAVELATAPWAEELFVSLVGTGPELPAAAERHNLSRVEDVDGLVDRLERRAEVQRSHLGAGSARQQRIDPELSDPWAPEVVLVAGELSADQQDRLRRLVTRAPRTTAAAVLPVAADDPAAGLHIRPGTAGPGLHAELRPLGWSLRVQQLSAPVQDAVVELLSVTGSEATTPAPWWSATGGPAAGSTGVLPLDPSPLPEPSAPVPPAVPDPGEPVAGEGWATNVTVLTPAPRRAWADEEDPAVERLRREDRSAPTGPVHHPTVLLLGPLDLVGATGVEPARAARQCLEYCAWLLEHPGATAPAMADALAVAEGTRRSNVSRLRAWLGSSAEGEPYLPDAYSGRIVLDPAVSSDWQRFQILTAPGIDRTSTEGLLAALELVRGAPLADAAPGQWHWAEELRTDMASAVRDLGVELARRALADGDLDLARWAAARALVAAPEDELLLCARLRTEHRAGRTAEVERLGLRLAGQARTLGIDLDPDTVTLLQQVMEGRVRARSG